jgi:hypothetical protein
MSMERIEKLLENIKETIVNPTMTDQEKLETIVDLVNIYKSPTPPQVDVQMLKSYVNAIILGTQRDTGVRH